MKRLRNGKDRSLDAEYKRRGLVRPTQAQRGFMVGNTWTATFRAGAIRGANNTEWFDWKGTRVWGVRP